jgi:hypothetical protein
MFDGKSMDKQTFIDTKTEEWDYANDYSGCNCPNGHPPCSYCVDGYSLSLDEYLDLALEYEFERQQPAPSNDNFDYAMKGLF